MPLAVTEKVAVWPDRMDWLTGCTLMNGATGLPVPCHPTPNVWRNCWLTNETLPDTSPVVEGAKVAVKVALAPGLKFSGSATPSMPRPVPEALAWEIVTGSGPELVMVKL